MAAPFIHDELILGIDEAGRGPVLGPMVMACVALRPRKAASLTRAGVTDSKAFAGLNAHEERQRLIPKILECADHVAAGFNSGHRHLHAAAQYLGSYRGIVCRREKRARPTAVAAFGAPIDNQIESRF